MKMYMTKLIVNVLLFDCSESASLLTTMFDEITITIGT